MPVGQPLFFMQIRMDAKPNMGKRTTDGSKNEEPVPVIVEEREGRNPLWV